MSISIVGIRRKSRRLSTVESQNYVNALRLVISILASASDESFFISAAGSALAGIAALVPVESAPELSHMRTEPQMSCRTCEPKHRVKLAIFAILQVLGPMLSDVRIAQIATLTQF
jgi:hypothetical protein